MIEYAILVLLWNCDWDSNCKHAYEIHTGGHKACYEAKMEYYKDGLFDQIYCVDLKEPHMMHTLPYNVHVRVEKDLYDWAMRGIEGK
jgi:hypothetical protein